MEKVSVISMDFCKAFASPVHVSEEKKQQQVRSGVLHVLKSQWFEFCDLIGQKVYHSNVHMDLYASRSI